MRPGDCPAGKQEGARPILDRRSLILGGTLIAGGLGVSALRPGSDGGGHSRTDFARLIPQSVGPWHAIDPRGVVLPPEDLLSQKIYDGFLVRGYANGAQPPIFLVVAFGAAQSYSMQLHRPETCYPASGYSIVDQSPQLFRFGQASIPGRFLRTRYLTPAQKEVAG